MTIEEVQAHIDTANSFIRTGKYHEAERLASEVLEYAASTASIHSDYDSVSEVKPFPVGEEREWVLQCTHAHFILLQNAHRRGKYEVALEQGERMLALAEKYSLQEIRLRTWNAIGNVNLHLGIYDKALEYYSNALAAFEERGAKPEAARVTGNIGLVYYSLGMYDKALEYQSKALATFEELGIQSGIANTTDSIGLVYIQLGDNDKALDYLSKALAIHQEMGQQSVVAITIGNMGGIYLNLNMFEKSLECYSNALTIHETLGEQSHAARVMGNIGNVYQNLGIYDKSLEYMLRALSMHEETRTQSSAAIIMGSIGVLYSNQNFDGYDSAKAEEYLLKAIALNEEIGAKQNLYENHLYLSNLYKQQERWKDFAVHFEQYHSIEKAVRSAEAQKQAERVEYQRKIEESERDRQVKLARFQEQEKILYNILPSQIADRIIDGEKTIADTYENVSVFFSDIVGFTKLSQQVTAQELVSMLNGIFSQFDQIARKHGLEKIKTIGDAYMAVCGAPIQQTNHAERTAQFALEVAEMMSNYSTNTDDKISIRIGLHSGNVVAGIIGENKFAYDLWGDAVNTASRMESHGEAGKIHVSEEFKHAVETLHATSLQFIPRGEMEIKGKGMMKTYFLESKE